jgi:hypothetical protein
VPIDPTPARARLADLDQASARLRRAVDALDSAGIRDAWRVVYRAYLSVDTSILAIVDALESLPAIGSALPDQDNRCDDCRGLLLRGSCPDCAPQVRT